MENCKKVLFNTRTSPIILANCVGISSEMEKANSLTKIRRKYTKENGTTISLHSESFTICKILKQLCTKEN